jgi:hypothetical protein
VPLVAGVATSTGIDATHAAKNANARSCASKTSAGCRASRLGDFEGRVARFPEQRRGSAGQRIRRIHTPAAMQPIEFPGIHLSARNC